MAKPSRFPAAACRGGCTFVVRPGRRNAEAAKRTRFRAGEPQRGEGGLRRSE